MFNATEFIYDGIYSAQYGLKIASFNSSVMEETPYAAPNLILEKSAKSKRYHYLDCVYDSPPTHSFSVVSEEAIPEEILREILIWLDSRRGFKPLVIMQSGLDELTYNCIFSIESMIYHAGRCIGLNLTATFDSQFVLGKPIEITVFGEGEPKNVEIYNDSDNIDGYIYPTVEFDAVDGKVSIVNNTDDKTREFAFDGVNSNTLYKVDNELKIITGEGSDLLSKFSKKWLRILRGKNNLRICVNGSVVVRFPRQIKISF